MNSILSLSQLTIGQPAIIEKIATKDEHIVRHLMAMGVMPGMPIILERRFPSYVVKVGRTRASLDEETASTIYIVPN